MSETNSNHTTLWRVLGIVVPVVPLLTIGIFKMYTHQQLQAERVERLEKLVYDYVSDHEGRHKDDLLGAQGRDQKQEEHFRNTDGAIALVRDEQTRRGEWVARLKDYERLLHELQLRMQRLEDRVEHRTVPPKDPLYVPLP